MKPNCCKLKVPLENPDFKSENESELIPKLFLDMFCAVFLYST